MGQGGRNEYGVPGIPRKNGTVASLLKAVTEPLSAEHEVEWIDVCTLNMKYCAAYIHLAIFRN